MAKKAARVVLNGRFSPGTVVALIEVRDERTLRPGAADREVDRKKVDKDGRVEFSSGVKDGGRYFVTGIQNGLPLNVRARGRAGNDTDTVNEVAPVQPERVRLADGSFLDEAPEREDAPGLEAAPHLGQRQVPEGQWQRSDTPRGSAHPHDPGEPAPYGSQEDVGEDVVQASSTRTGRAAPVRVGPQRQEDVKDSVVQRSATRTGVATPIPKRGPVRAQIDKESVEGKELRGEPVRVAAEPIDGAKPVRGASAKAAAKRQAKLAESSAGEDDETEETA